MQLKSVCLAFLPSALLNQSSAPPLAKRADEEEEAAKLKALLPVLDTPELESQWFATAAALDGASAVGAAAEKGAERAGSPRRFCLGWSGTKSHGLVCCTGFTDSPSMPIVSSLLDCAEAGESDDSGGDDEEEELDLDEDERTAEETIIGAPLFIVDEEGISGISHNFPTALPQLSGKVKVSESAGNSKLADGCCSEEESSLEGWDDDEAVAPSGMYGRD